MAGLDTAGSPSLNATRSTASECVKHSTALLLSEVKWNQQVCIPEYTNVCQDKYFYVLIPEKQMELCKEVLCL